MKKLSLTLMVLLSFSSNSFAWDCDGGSNSLIVADKAVETGNDVDAAAQAVIDDELVTAIKEKDLGKVLYFLSEEGGKANPNAFVKNLKQGDGQRFNGLTVLSYAVKISTPEIARALLKAGANPDGRDQNAQTTTALLQAVRENGQRSVDFIDVLLEYKANPNLGAAGGRTPLDFAAWWSNVDATKRLVKEANINLNQESVFVTGKGDTALSSSCFYGSLENIKALLGHNEAAVPFTKDHLDKALIKVKPEIKDAVIKEFENYKSKYKI